MSYIDSSFIGLQMHLMKMYPKMKQPIMKTNIVISYKMIPCKILGVKEVVAKTSLAAMLHSMFGIKGKLVIFKDARDYNCNL